MFRYLLLIVAIWLAILIIRQMLRRNRLQNPPRTNKVETMVKCAHCGTHLPEKNAIRDGNHHYCSVEHRRAANP